MLHDLDIYNERTSFKTIFLIGFWLVESFISASVSIRNLYKISSHCQNQCLSLSVAKFGGIFFIRCKACILALIIERRLSNTNFVNFTTKYGEMLSTAQLRLLPHVLGLDQWFNFHTHWNALTRSGAKITHFSNFLENVIQAMVLSYPKR